MQERLYYTLQEANAMLPKVTALIEQLQGMARQQAMLQGHSAEVTQKTRSNGHHNPIEDPMVAQSTLALAEGMRVGMQQLSDWGIELKDLSTGLIDFRALRQGREVYLCWRMGEPEVAYWHEIEGGFAGRKPVDDLTG